MLLPTYKDTDFAQDFMCSAPGNPVFARAIELNLEMRRRQSGGIYDRGPRAYCKAVMETVFGLKGQCLESTVRAEKIRKTLHKTKGLETQREDPSVCDVVIFRLDDGQRCDRKQWALDKAELYEMAGIGSWNGAVEKTLKLKHEAVSV